jgi:hypothetical protein
MRLPCPTATAFLLKGWPAPAIPYPIDLPTELLTARCRAFLIKSSRFIPSTSVRRRSVSTVGVLSPFSIKLNVCRDNPARAVITLRESFWRNRSSLSNRDISEQIFSRNVSLPTLNNYKNPPLTSDATRVACRYVYETSWSEWATAVLHWGAMFANTRNADRRFCCCRAGHHQ